MDDFESEYSGSEPKVEAPAPKKPRKKQQKLNIEEPVMSMEESVEEPSPELLGPIDDDEIINLARAPKIKVKPKLAKIAKPKKIKVDIRAEEPRFVEATPEPVGPAIEEPIELPQEMLPEPVPDKPAEDYAPVSSPQSPEKKNDLVKWFFAGMFIVIAIGAGLVWMSRTEPTGFFPVHSDTTKGTGLAVYEPTDLLSGWQLNETRTNLAEMPSNLRVEMMSQNVSDAALWHYVWGKEDLFVWLRTYPDKATLRANDKSFTSAFAWRDFSYLGIGDGGRVGAYKVTNTTDISMLYLAKDSTMVYIAYNNDNGKYNASSAASDQRFLVDLGRKMLVKVFGEDALPVAEELSITDNESK